MILESLSPLANHMWQSTLFAGAAGLLTLALRRNHARTRYWVWLTASVKFLIPLSLLVALGNQIGWRTVPAAMQPRLPTVMEEISQPFPAPATPVLFTHVLPAASPLPAILWSVWGCGFIGIAFKWWLKWRHLRSALRDGSRLQLDLDIPVVSSSAFLEPGVFGVFRPILLLPEGITECLTPAQLEAIIVHELCHVRRRDNLAATVHMLVEALFWFHPLVWWIRTRLIDERERACDEEVLQLGSDPGVYAQGILKVCEFYLESPVAFVAGVSGPNLKKRIEGIMSNRIARRLSGGKRLLLAGAGVLAVAAPIVVGMMNASSARAQLQPPALDAFSVKPSGQNSREASVGIPPGGTSAAPRILLQSPAVTGPQPVPVYLSGLGSVAAFYTVTVKPRVDGQLMSVSFNEGDLVKAGQVLASIDPRPYEIQLAQAEGQLIRDQATLNSARGDLDRYEKLQAQNAIPKPQIDTQIAMVAELEGSIRTDQANVDHAKLQLTYTQLTAPITGVAGLRLVDPGNIVHAADATGIVIITQLQPIAVRFTIPEDSLPQVLVRLREGASLPVEVWNRDNTVKIATGRLTAVDNQIDPTTGTAKLKAVFDNKDGALFPNQFVNVRLLVATK